MTRRTQSANPNYDLTKRTAGENMWLWRHRQPSRMGQTRGRRAGGMGQEEMAAALGLDEKQLIKFEDDESITVTAAQWLRRWLPEIMAIKPSIAELCYLARRRSGRLLDDIAADVGLSDVAYMKAETTSREDVVSYWRRQGYKFPGIRLVRPTQQATARLTRPAA